MSIFDFIPEELRQYLPFSKKSADRDQLKAQLDELQKQLEQKQNAPENPDGVPVENEQADAQTNELSDSINRIKSMLAEPDVPWYRKAIKIGLYIIPLVLSYFLAIYLQENGGLELDHQEMVYPVGLFELDEGNPPTFALSEESENRFWPAFSRYYFDTKTDPFSRFDRNLLFFDDTASFIETKVVLKNTSSSFPLMVSSLEIDVTYADSTGFPWENVDVTPKIDVTVRSETFIIKNAGFAPALNPKTVYRLTNEDSVEILDAYVSFDDGRYYMEGGDDIEHPNIPHVNNYTLANLMEETRSLRDSFYVYHEPADPKNADFKYTILNGNEFLIVSNLDQLKQYTDVIETRQINMRFSYESVRKETFAEEWTTELDYLLAYYENSEVLLTYEEALHYGMYPVFRDHQDNSVSAVADLSYTLAQKLYTALGNKPSPHPEGVSLITENIEINLAYFGHKETFTSFANTDQILNPDGYVVLYLKLRNPKNGRYNVKVKTNGEDISEVDIETLIPEQTKFNLHYLSMDLFNPPEFDPEVED